MISWIALISNREFEKIFYEIRLFFETVCMLRRPTLLFLKFKFEIKSARKNYSHNAFCPEYGATACRYIMA